MLTKGNIMILWTIRAIFFLLVFSILLLGFREGGPFDFKDIENLEFHQLLVFLGCFAVLFTGFFVDLLVPRKRIANLVGLFFGMMVGLLVGMMLNQVVEFVYETYNISANTNYDLFVAKGGIKWLINILCSFIAIIFILQTKDDFRFVIPYVEFSKQTKGVVPLILDTSVIIDGRIADIAATKILNSPLIVPRFVLNELHGIADSADRLRRNRGRRGLDMLNKMQSNKEIDVSIQDIELSASEKAEPVDYQLVSVTNKLSGKLVTNDYNLNKVAILRGAEVININDLANAMKPVVLPGGAMRVKMVKSGDQPGQGVGYLDDGTMVVIDQGRQYIGSEMDLTVTSVLQTSAGRMIFGKKTDNTD